MKIGSAPVLVAIVSEPGNAHKPLLGGMLTVAFRSDASGEEDLLLMHAQAALAVLCREYLVRHEGIDSELTDGIRAAAARLRTEIERFDSAAEVIGARLRGVS